MDFTNLDLGQQGGQMPDRALGAARLVNCYPLTVGEDGVVPFPLVACAPLKEYMKQFDLSAGGTGGTNAEMIERLTTDDFYLFTNNSLFKENSGALLAVGGGAGAQVGPNCGYNTMALNNNTVTPEVAFIEGSSFVLKKVISATVSTVSTAALTSATVTGLIPHDGYVILLFDSGEWFIPALNTLTYDPLDFTTFVDPEGGYTKLLGGASRGKELIIFTATAMAIYRNTGAADFPYEQIDTRSIGMFSNKLLRKITMPDGEDTIIWAASDRGSQYKGICVLRGYQPAVVSTPAIDHFVLAHGTDASGITSFAFTERGRTFYALRSVNGCHVWDSTTGLWHERQTDGTNTWDIIGSGRLEQLQVLYSTANGSLLNYEGNDESVSSEAKAIKVRTSLDNGATWREYRTAKTILESADYNQQFKWTRFGQSRQDGFVVQIDITNAVEHNYAVSADIDNYADTMSVVLPQLQAWPGYVRMFRLEVDVATGNNPLSSYDTGKMLSLVRSRAGVKVVGLNR